MGRDRTYLVLSMGGFVSFLSSSSREEYPSIIPASMSTTLQSEGVSFLCLFRSRAFQVCMDISKYV